MRNRLGYNDIQFMKYKSICDKVEQRKGRLFALHVTMEYFVSMNQGNGWLNLAKDITFNKEMK